MRAIIILLLAATAGAWPHSSFAQSAPPAQAPATRPADDPDRDINLSQPDFTLVALPTTLRLPKFKSSFRVTHRFIRPLGAGDFGDLASDFFGLDSGAQIGLEYRFGVWSGLQAGFHRTSDRTIEFFGDYNVLRQTADMPVAMNVIASVDGTNNFRDEYTPSIGAAVSHELGRHGAVYAEPMWVHHSNLALNPAPGEDTDTFMVGLGARVRIRPTVYLVGEFTPRTGYTPGVNQGSFGIEKRAGGHLFQLNFSNGFGTTMGQVARGGTASSDWYMGFNISRKFF